jgi:hypothetical protein
MIILTLVPIKPVQAAEENLTTTIHLLLIYNSLLLTRTTQKDRAQDLDLLTFPIYLIFYPLPRTTLPVILNQSPILPDVFEAMPIKLRCLPWDLKDLNSQVLDWPKGWLYTT